MKRGPLHADAVERTDIKAIKYRKFVQENPSRTTYFQPVLDALQVKFSPLERSEQALIVEGKFDFFPISYFKKRGILLPDVDVFPANGAGDIGLLINIFRGWGVNFRILLDDDKGGREGKARYRKEYLVPDNQVVTIGEIIPSFAGSAFEGLYQEDVKLAVQEYIEHTRPKKRDYSLFFQSLLAREADVEFPETEMYIQQLAEWLEVSFKE